jgi:hypothetical protein
MTTPRLALEQIPTNSLQPGTAVNDALQVLDATVQPVAQALTATPPTTVAGDVGKVWLIDASATGVWAGKDGQIALCTAAATWRYLTPGTGWRYDVGGTIYRYAAGLWTVAPVAFTGGNLTAALNEAKGADIASAATTDIGAATGNFVHITGTTTITALGTVQAGTRRVVRFAGALTLTHNATSLILPTGANITTAANDTAVFVSEGSGNWRCVGYQRANGQALAAAAATLPITALSIASGVVNIDLSLGRHFTLSLTSNVTSITFTNLPASGFAAEFSLRIVQDATGGRTVALPSSFKATGGSDTAVASAANAVTLLTAVTFSQGTTWTYAMQDVAA